MNRSRFSIGVLLFLGSLVIARMAFQYFTGALPPGMTMQEVWSGYGPTQRVVFIGCFVMNAWALGIVVDELIRMTRSKG